MSATLFDASPYLAKPEKRTAIDLDALADYAFLYTGTARGNCSGVRFMATIEHAQRWCESDLSRGTLHGTEWAYFWTSVANYLRRWGFDDIDAETFDLADVIDNGEWDERVASTGCVMLKRRQIAAVLNAAGVKAT